MTGTWIAPLAVAGGTTLALAAMAFPLGTVIGIALAAASRGGPATRLTARLYTTVLRGVPELVILYILYFSGGAMLRDGLKAVPLLADRDPGLVIGAVALGLVSGAFQGEAFRGALAAIASGEIEAARSIGMSPPMIARRLLWPQMLAIALPALGNVWQGLLKATAIVSVIGLVELMRQTILISASTLAPFAWLSVAAMIYLAMSAGSDVALRFAERRMAWAAGR